MFDACVKFCKENGTSDPTTVECCPNVDLMAWPSREGWLHGVKFLLLQGGAEGTDERVLALRVVRCRVRDERSHFRGGRT